MKILFVNYQDNYGAGSYRAAYRLYQRIQGGGVECNYIARNRLSIDKTVLEVPLRGMASKILYKASWLVFRTIFKNQLSARETAWSPNLISEQKQNLFARLNPDIVHLHWICGDFISIDNLKHIRKPTVWTIHDMWPFTGRCHYSSNCDRYQQTCGFCPQLKSRSRYDLSRLLYNKKRKAYRQVPVLTVVSPSRWLAEKASESSLLTGRNIHVIPNGIDHHVFKNPGKAVARDMLNLPKNKLMILFGAVRVTSNPRKGFHYLKPALHHISNRFRDVEAIVLGSNGPDGSSELGLTTHYLGFLHDEFSLSLAYSAADVTVVPSTDENLSTVIMESLSCGTPVVGFDIGGNADLVEHERNGYLARPFEVDDLVSGIAWVLSNEERRHKLSFFARNKVEKEFTLDIVAAKYLSLYKNVINS